MYIHIYMYRERERDHTWYTLCICICTHTHASTRHTHLHTHTYRSKPKSRPGPGPRHSYSHPHPHPYPHPYSRACMNSRWTHVISTYSYTLLSLNIIIIECIIELVTSLDLFNKLCNIVIYNMIITLLNYGIVNNILVI